MLYINDLSTVSEACMSILFADDTNMFFTGKNLQTMTTVINEELTKVQEWLYCNKLSLNVLKTHYMIFKSRNKCMNDVDIRINNVKIERVYATKFLGVQIDAQLTWKKAYWIYMQKNCANTLEFSPKLGKSRINHRSWHCTIHLHFHNPYTVIMCREIPIRQIWKVSCLFKKSWFVLLVVLHSRLIQNLLCLLEEHCLWLI